MHLIFGLEMILKILAFGFLFNGSNSYLRNSSNILDFIVISLSVSNYRLSILI